MEVELIYFHVQVGHLHFYFLQEKTADDESILSQQGGCFEQDCASHISIKFCISSLLIEYKSYDSQFHRFPTVFAIYYEKEEKFHTFA